MQPGFPLGFGLYFCAALGTGDDNFSLTHWYPANGLAVFAGKIPVLFVSVAGPGILTLIF